MSFLFQWGIPFVALGKSQDGIEYSYVRIEAAEAYLSLVRHIQSNGFSQLAFIGGLSDLINQIDRLKWFRAATKKCGLDVYRDHIVSTDMTSAGGYEAASALLDSSIPPNAILCANDEAAFGAIHAAWERGLKIGVDIAIAGFDGVRDSQHVEPALTTLNTPVDDIARQLADMLLNGLNGSPLETRDVIVHPQLVIRASTGG